jgi:cytochrome c556
MRVHHAVIAALVLMSAAPHAQRRGGAPANTDMPVATNTIAQNPEQYYGKPMTLSAGVQAVLSKTAFLVDQERSTGGPGVVAVGNPILVIAPYLTVALDPHSYLLMRGQLMKFDPAAIRGAAIGYTLDLPPEMIAKYQGQAVLVAASILTSTYKEVAKKPIPPQTAADISMTAAMKTISPAFAALRTAAQESKADVVAENAAKLERALNEAETIWAGLGETRGTQWTHEARDSTASIQRAAAAGTWDAVNTSAGALNQTCQTCHAAYRERQEDGTYRMKR